MGSELSCEESGGKTLRVNDRPIGLAAERSRHTDRG